MTVRKPPTVVNHDRVLGQVRRSAVRADLPSRLRHPLAKLSPRGASSLRHENSPHLDDSEVGLLCV
jgi:hypothetical protein